MIEFLGIPIQSAAVPTGEAYLVPRNFYGTLPMLPGETLEAFTRRLLSDPETASQCCVIRGIGK